MKFKSTPSNSSSRRKKIISTKLCNVSMGSVSKDNLKGKNRILALEVQKAKITLGKLNEKYISLQQENQDNMILLNKKRMKINNLQKIYETETKKGIEKATEKVDIMLNRYLTELFINSTTIDMRNRQSSSSRSPIRASRSQLNCAEKPQVDRIDRKIRRSRLSLDQKLAAKQPVKSSENTKQFNEKMCNTSSVTNKGRHPSSVVMKAPSFSNPVHDNKETFVAIPIGMISDMADDNHIDDVDMEMAQDFQPLNVTLCELTSESDTFNPAKCSKQTNSKQTNVYQSDKDLIVSQDGISPRRRKKSNEKLLSVKECKKTCEPTKSLEGDSKEKPANKLLLTSRDRTKICNVRDMIIPKPKVKSKSCKKEEIKVLEKSKSSPSKIPVFDFSMQSPTIELPESYKEIPEDIQLPGGDRNPTEMASETKSVKSKSRSKMKDITDSKSSPVSSKSDSQLLKKIKSLNKVRSKKNSNLSDSQSDSNIGQTQNDPSTTSINKLNSVSLKANSSSTSAKTNERSGQSKSSKPMPHNTTETHSETYTVPMKTGSPEQKSGEPRRRGRSRSRGRTVNNSDQVADPQINSPTNEVKRSRRVDLKDSDDNTDSKTTDNLLSYTVPMKTDSPKKLTTDLKKRSRSRSRGRPLKETTNDKSKSTTDETYAIPMKPSSPKKSTNDSQRRGRSKSRGRKLKDDEVPLLLANQEETIMYKQSTEDVESKSMNMLKKNGITSIDDEIKSTEDEITKIDAKDVTKKIKALKSKLGIDKDANHVPSETACTHESEKLEEYSVPLKTGSPEEKLKVRRARSRSRGRPKAQDDTLEKPESSAMSQRSRSKSRGQNKQIEETVNSELKSFNSKQTEIIEYDQQNCIKNQERSKPSMKRGRSKSRKRIDISDSESDEIARSPAPKRRSRSRSRRQSKNSEAATKSEKGMELNDVNSNPSLAVITPICGKSPQRHKTISENVPRIVIERPKDISSLNGKGFKTKSPFQVLEDSICIIFKNRPSMKTSKKSLVMSSPTILKQTAITPEPCPLVKQSIDGRSSSLDNQTSTSKRNIESIGSRDSIDINNGDRKSRRAAASVSYKEPTLNSKLRREDVQKKLLDKEIEKKRLSGQE